MRCLVLSCLCVFAMTACGGGGTGDDGTTFDAACVGGVYDTCVDQTTSADCMAGLSCHYFMQDNLTVCVPTCDANNPCPVDDGGTLGECNMRGICKPTVAGVCSP